MQLLIAALERLRSNVEYTSLLAYLLQVFFTLPQLQQAYQVILDRSCVNATSVLEHCLRII